MSPASMAWSMARRLFAVSLGQLQIVIERTPVKPIGFGDHLGSLCEDLGQTVTGEFQSRATAQERPGTAASTRSITYAKSLEWSCGPRIAAEVRNSPSGVGSPRTARFEPRNRFTAKGTLNQPRHPALNREHVKIGNLLSMERNLVVTRDWILAIANEQGTDRAAVPFAKLMLSLKPLQTQQSVAQLTRLAPPLAIRRIEIKLEISLALRIGVI